MSCLNLPGHFFICSVNGLDWITLKDMFNLKTWWNTGYRSRHSRGWGHAERSLPMHRSSETQVHWYRFWIVPSLFFLKYTFSLFSFRQQGEEHSQASHFGRLSETRWCSLPEGHRLSAAIVAVHSVVSKCKGCWGAEQPPGKGVLLRKCTVAT